MKPDELNEFLVFLNSEATPPKEMEVKLFHYVKKALNPSRAVVIVKLFLFHILGSVITLLFCPQQGLSIFGTPGITSFLMDIHPGFCFLACGLFWMVGGQALTYSFLTIDEQRVLGGYRWMTAFTILLLSILLFAALGTLELDAWFLLWALGALTSVFVFNGKTILEQKRLRIGISL